MSKSSDKRDERSYPMSIPDSAILEKEGNIERGRTEKLQHLIFYRYDWNVTLFLVENNTKSRYARNFFMYIGRSWFDNNWFFAKKIAYQRFKRAVSAYFNTHVCFTGKCELRIFSRMNRDLLYFRLYVFCKLLLLNPFKIFSEVSCCLVINNISYLGPSLEFPFSFSNVFVCSSQSHLKTEAKRRRVFSNMSGYPLMHPNIIWYENKTIMRN